MRSTFGDFLDPQEEFYNQAPNVSSWHYNTQLYPLVFHLGRKRKYALNGNNDLHINESYRGSVYRLLLERSWGRGLIKRIPWLRRDHVLKN